MRFSKPAIAIATPSKKRKTKMPAMALSNGMSCLLNKTVPPHKPPDPLSLVVGVVTVVLLTRLIADLEVEVVERIIVALTGFALKMVA